MQAVRFDEDQHLEAAKAWAKAWGQDTLHTLPVGFVVPGVACAFVCETNADFVILDNLVSNRDASKADRDAAVPAVLLACENYAKEKGYDKVVAFSANPAAVGRALQVGYRAVGSNFTALLREIR